ncbi:hypothetical protein ACFV8T_26215 [Streptomyces sp. NPDC059832]|uniref:hypothetical protein n=1 Tax=unclassified Streptomyces TaxID=2593676 RepID=UPI003648C392
MNRPHYGWRSWKSGATAGLCDATMPDEERPADGSAGRLKRYLAFRRYMWSRL